MFSLRHMKTIRSTSILIVCLSHLLPLTASRAAWYWEVGSQSANMADGHRTGVASESGYEYYFKDTNHQLKKLDRFYWKWGASWWTTFDVGTGFQANVKDWITYHPSQVGGSDVIYYQGWDNHLWAVYQENQHQITTFANVAGDVVVNARLNIIFYRGTDSGIYAVYWGGSSWVQTPIGSQKNADGAFSIDSNRHYLYYRGTDRRLWILFWDGSNWAQAIIGPLGNVNEPVTTDTTNLITYYRSWQDSSMWAVYWGGSSWIQTKLDASAWMTPFASGGAIFDAKESSGEPGRGAYVVPVDPVPSLPPGNRMLYIDRNGRLEEEVWMGSGWGHRWIGDGAWGLTNGLSVGKSSGWVFARRSDGSIVVFYWDN